MEMGFTGIWLPSEVYGFWDGGGIGPTEVLVYVLLEAEACKDGVEIDTRLYARRIRCREERVRLALRKLSDCNLVREVSLGRWTTFQVLP